MEMSIIISSPKKKRVITISRSGLARDTGYDKSHISRVFAGKTKPSLECVQAMAKALGITVDELTNKVLTKRKKGLKVIYAD